MTEEYFFFKTLIVFFSVRSLFPFMTVLNKTLLKFPLLCDIKVFAKTFKLSPCLLSSSMSRHLKEIVEKAAKQENSFILLLSLLTFLYIENFPQFRPVSLSQTRNVGDLIYACVS